MASIHGIVYVMVGAAVSIVSYYLDKEKLIFFIIVGAILFLFGILKLLFMLMIKKNKPQQPQHNPYHGQYAQQAPPNGAHRFCPRCRRTIHATFNFCPYCGLRI
ncbi:MAG: hypothetical protein R6V53_00935 [Candidatus Woesearchaeota archaeon]